MTAQLPCDGDGICMVCKSKPPEVETLECKTCITPWHVTCLSKPPESLSATLQWDCPDCSNVINSGVGGASSSSSNSSLNQLVSLICAIESDTTLNDHQKAKRRQELISGVKASDPCENEDEKMKEKESDVMNILHDKLMCLICMQLPHRPVTTPCGHNFCLKCFEKWVKQQPRKQNCPECRSKIPDIMVNQPKINSALVVAIRMAKAGENSGSGSHRHSGPILAEKDPRNQGSVLVGEYGAQSVALSGDYEDDDNHGDWFLYTGSGGRDLSGNDQSYEKSNEALRVSCLRGYPVRVVRSHKEKRSSYAPLNGLRCGVYRIEKCWRKIGNQGHKVCRYLFVRCDNEPAPWSSDTHGDRPRPLPVIKELKGATNITDRKDSPSWDYDEKDSCWKWKKSPPNTTTAVAISSTTIEKSECGNNLQTTPEVAVCKVLEKEDDDNSKKLVQTEASQDFERAWKKAQNKSNRNQLLNALKCQLCREVMNRPLTTPCAHNFCKVCLESVFAGKSSVRKRYFCQGRSLRAQKSIMKCPSCPMDLSEFLQNPQVNRELMAVIEDLQHQAEEENDEDSSEETEGFNKPENMVAFGKDGGDNSDMLDDILEIEGEPKQMNKRLKTKSSDLSGNVGKSEFKSNESVEEMKLDDADGGNVVINDAVKEVVKTSKTFTTEPKPKCGSLPKPELNKRGRQKKTEETAVSVVADEVLKMVRGKEMSGTGDNSRINGTSSNHLIEKRSLVKRSTNGNKMTTLHATPALIVPDIDSTSTTGANGAVEGAATEKEGKNKGHACEVEKEQEAVDKHVEERDEDNKEHAPGFIFMCSAQTKLEIFKYRVFGLPLRKMHVVENIEPGAMLFLFDFNLKLLHGVYKATSRGERDLEPAAFGGRFPAQVRFSIFRECLPVPESVFRHSIKENYHGGTNFQQQLSNCQVKKLFALFHPIGWPAEAVLGASPRQSPPVKIYQNRQPSRLPPPNDPYASTAFHHARHTYSCENALVPAHNPYTRYRAAPYAVSQGAKVSENEHNLQLLLAERKREQEQQLVRHFGGAGYYSMYPSHAAATTYAVEPSHAFPETHHSRSSSYTPLHHNPPTLVNDASSHALPPPHHTPHTSLYGASVHSLPPLHRTPPPLSYDPSCQAYVPAAAYNFAPSYAHALGPAYWSAVAREDPNQVYI